MASQVANFWKYYKLNLLVGKTFKIYLMAPGFLFNRATHKHYTDISASELTTANGYTSGGQSLAGISVSQDDTNNRGIITWSNAQWTASSNGIAASGAIVHDSTDDVIAGFIDFGGTQTALAGAPFIVANISVEED